VKPSKKKGFKMDVYRNGFLVSSVGKVDELDYATALEMEQEGKLRKGTAEKWREYYVIKHMCQEIFYGTILYYEYNLLWC
jgi:hypothetical protein